ncbi:DNA-directed RNA polymerase subunit omega [Leptotrichia sp. oral taxon 847]|uniref:DNA-directed RNA polymerase subunit omega n=1 Tax=Leptotrichia sp. oral taxon 847 TaxID=1785996 RepID=UPI0007683C03|nr:DNA-directed RNA polymerase subunit omega [Leptotrichia sp. oral taxon 847]AMD95508.1 DNA-directed RNA polymerase subunit omega [Leptotrichia sp. oral taxon 847]
MKKEKITIDELLEKVPNKYELAIVAGKIAKVELKKDKAKFEVMDEVFSDIMNDEVEIIYNDNKKIEDEEI